MNISHEPLQLRPEVFSPLECTLSSIDPMFQHFRARTSKSPWSITVHENIQPLLCTGMILGRGKKLKPARCHDRSIGRSESSIHQSSGRLEFKNVRSNLESNDARAPTLKVSGCCTHDKPSNLHTLLLLAAQLHIPGETDHRIELLFQLCGVIPAPFADKAGLRQLGKDVAPTHSLQLIHSLPQFPEAQESSLPRNLSEAWRGCSNSFFNLFVNT